MDGFKQRIVGAIVLVSLAVIFIPIIFEETHDYQETRTITIPPKPEVPKFRIEDPVSPTLQGNTTPYTPKTSEQASEYIAEAADRRDAKGRVKAVSEKETAVPEPVAAVKPVIAKANTSTMSEEGDKEKEPGGDKTPVTRAESTPSSKTTLEKTPIAPITDLWWLQIGTFKNSDSAQQLKTSLDGASVKVYADSFEQSGNQLTRVYAGPFSSQKAAAEFKARVDAEFKLQSLVTKKRPG